MFSEPHWLDPEMVDECICLIEELEDKPYRVAEAEN